MSEDINFRRANRKVFVGYTKIISSVIPGLGKSFKIRKIIKENNFYFSLGGKLTKNLIFEKLNNILIKIKNENYKDIAIHLDLEDTNDIEIMNEFLFSFLITKFYKNNDNIIYIPKDIYIYIEIPNCFEDYLSKFSILKYFNQEILTFENMPKFNFSDEIIKIFKMHLGIDSNDKLQKFIKRNICIEKFSYYQINIFIKLFISQFCQISYKVTFH